VAVKNHARARQPEAQFRKEITVDMVLNSARRPTRSAPRLLLFTDGGAAVVLAAEEVARKRPDAVWVLASQAPPTHVHSREA